MRKSIDIEIQDREQLLKFRIKEMSATQLEAWWLKAVLLLNKANQFSASNLQLPQVTGSPQKNIGQNTAQNTAQNMEQNMGQSLSSSLGFGLGQVPYEELKPLLDELLTCCSRVLDNGLSMQLSPNNVDGIIEEMETLLKLKTEAFKVNFSFLLKDGLPNLQKSSPQNSGANPTASHTMQNPQKAEDKSFNMRASA